MEWRSSTPAAAARRMLAAVVPDAAPEPRPADRAFPLAAFQEAAARRARSIVRARGGVIVADAVGLGKTYVALALIEEAVRAGEDVTVVVPASLRTQWRAPLDALAGGRVRLVSHTQLSRGRHAAPHGTRGLVVVDEAHAFRNPVARRYRSLKEAAVGCRVVLLTATPVNNRLTDLLHLVELFAADGDFRDVGVPSLRDSFRAAERGTGAGIVEVRRVAREVVVRRTRAMAEAWSSQAGGPVSPAIDAGDGAGSRFPRRASPLILRYAAPGLSRAAEVVDGLELAAWAGEAEGAGAAGVAALLKLGLLKRIESGASAGRRTARRHLAFARAALRAAGEGRRARAADVAILASVQGDGDCVQLALDTLLIEEARPGEDLAALRRSLARDVAALRRLLGLLEDPDPKLDAVGRALAAIGSHERILVFSEFRDTAEALWRRLAPGGGVGRIDGSGAWLGLRRAGRRAVLERFAPRAHGRPEPPDRERVRILITTDVLSEGLNLQDARHVISYDLPWNPVRLLQRIGRVDRLGSPHEEVVPYLVVPADGLEEVLRLVRRLRRKLGHISDAIGDPEADALLNRLGGSAGTRPAGSAEEMLHPLDGVTGPDPWERLRDLARLALGPGGGGGNERSGGGTAEPSAGAHGPTGTAWYAEVRMREPEDDPTGWIVALRDPRRGWLLEVTAAGAVREAGEASVRALRVALGDAPQGPPRRRGAEGAARAAGLAIRYLRGIQGAGHAPPRPPAGFAASSHGRLARRLRAALVRLGPAPPPGLVRRVDRALAALAEAPPPPAPAPAHGEGRDPGSETPMVEELLRGVERRTAGSAPAAGPAGGAPIEVVAALRVRPLNHAGFDVDGGVGRR